MISMSLEPILQSAGTSLDELNGIVEQYREFTNPRPDMLLADHFDVEFLSTVIEVLAGRLEKIQTLIEPHLEEIGTAAHLAQAIDDVVTTALTNATTLIEKHLGVEGIPAGSDKLIGEQAVYGHPDYRFVIHACLSVETLRYLRHGYVVHLPTSSIYPALEDEGPAKAVERISRLRAKNDDTAGTE